MTQGTVNLTTTLAWNYLVGERQAITGPDGLATTFTYDNFGRIKRETRPVGYTDFSYDDCYVCWPMNARLYVRSQGSDGSDSYQFFDRLQRPVGESWTLPLGTHGRQETRYDPWGRVEKVSKPYVHVDPVFWVTYQYDNLDRTREEDAPVSEAQPTGATTTYQYVGRDLWVTDAESHVTKYENNALGQIAKVTDALNGTTTYAYKHFGELGTVTDAESKVTTISYDPRGYKSSTIDPNMGTWNYEYNVHGELARQKSPITTTTVCSPGTWTVCLAYDQAGRPTSRVELEGTTTFAYYHPTTGPIGARGKPYQTSTTNYIEQYTYNPTHGAPSQLRRTIEGTAYDFDMTFDSQARLNVLTYPTSTSGYRFAVDYDYDTFGHMNVVKDASPGSTGSTFYTLTEADALGREVRVDLGDYATGLDEYRTFDRAAGYLKGIDTGPSLSSTIQDLEFTYDEVGNLKTRKNKRIGGAPGITETFVYDELNRLRTAQVTGQSAVSINYSASGRITSKSDYGGTYTYNPTTRPYAVTNAGGQSYVYDAAGRMTTHGSDAFTWYTYDLPKKLAVATKTAEFWYGTDRQRYKQIQKTGATTNATIYYVGTLFEKEIAGATTYRHYVSARGRTIAMVNRVNTTNTVQYLHRDHQGSVVEVTNAVGGLVQSLAYDAWGLRRNAATWAALPSPFGGAEPTERGYTGHEHLDKVELIHMNGRVQDPRLGRFISADPFVQAPYSSQSLNRYSYVRNNPASRVDPSGFQECWDQPGGCQRGLPPPLYGVPSWWIDTVPYASEPSPSSSGGTDAGADIEPRQAVVVPQGGVGINWGLVQQSFGQMTADDWRGSIRDAVDGALEFPLASQLDSVGGVGDMINSGVDLTEGNWRGAAVTAVTSRIPGSKALRSFAGGAYGKLKSIVGWERHHMPADSISPLSRARGPAIQMEQAEHALTSSYGNSAAAQAYRQEIGALIRQGRWRDAMAQEIRDVRRIAGSKYNQAAQQMLEYGRSIGVID